MKVVGVGTQLSGERVIDSMATFRAMAYLRGDRHLVFEVWYMDSVAQVYLPKSRKTHTYLEHVLGYVATMSSQTTSPFLSSLLKLKPRSLNELHK